MPDPLLAAECSEAGGGAVDVHGKIGPKGKVYAGPRKGLVFKELPKGTRVRLLFHHHGDDVSCDACLGEIERLAEEAIVLCAALSLQKLKTQRITSASRAPGCPSR